MFDLELFVCVVSKVFVPSWVCRIYIKTIIFPYRLLSCESEKITAGVALVTVTPKMLMLSSPAKGLVNGCCRAKGLENNKVVFFF